MVGILHIVPVQPRHWIQADAEIPRLTHNNVLRALRRPDRFRVVLTPQLQKNGAAVIDIRFRQGVVLVGVRSDHLGVLLGDAVFLGVLLYGLYKIAPGNDDPRLRLHVPAVRVSEEYAGVLNDRRSDRAFDPFGYDRVGIPIGVCTSVPVHGSISHKLARHIRDAVVLHKGGELFVHDGNNALHLLVVRSCRERLGVHRDVVGGYICHLMKNNTF